jgi:uncharacterized protein YccT (UPF0319 family)
LGWFLSDISVYFEVNLTICHFNPDDIVLLFHLNNRFSKKETALKYQHFVFLIVTLLALQGCNVKGPVHVYSGEPRPTSETALLQVPAPICVEKIDGKDVDVPSNEDGFYEIYLLPGLHRIEFKYELYWGDGTSGMIIASDVVGIETPFNAGMKYSLSYRVPGDEEEAFWMSNNFKATLIEQQTGRKISSRTLEELNQRGVQTTLVYDSQNVEQSGVKTKPPEENERFTPPPGMDADTASQADAVRRLKFWWLMADQEERKRFKQWMKSLENTNSDN